jgi:hypothetical protein
MGLFPLGGAARYDAAGYTDDGADDRQEDESADTNRDGGRYFGSDIH